MAEKIVSKFGGTSNATAQAVEQSMELARNSLVTVVSAPGELTDQQLNEFEYIPESVPIDFFKSKVSHQLNKSHTEYGRTGEVPPYIIESIHVRYMQIASKLGQEAINIARSVPERVTYAARDKIAAFILGEEVQLELYATQGFRYIPPAQSRFKPTSIEHVADWAVHLYGRVAPGQNHGVAGNIYYQGGQRTPNGKGGSDTTGSIVASALLADVYENWTDTMEMSADPKYIPPERLKPIYRMTKKERRELGLHGSNIMHPDSIVPLIDTNIPIKIRNTFDPDGEYTLLTDEPTAERIEGEVIGLSMIEDVAVFKIYEPDMSGNHGRVFHYAKALDDKAVNLIRIPDGGSDTHIFIVDAKDQETSSQALQSASQDNTRAKIESFNKSLIIPVGLKVGLNSRQIQNKIGYDTQDVPVIPGIDSLGFLVDKDKKEELFDTFHRRLIEHR